MTLYTDQNMDAYIDKLHEVLDEAGAPTSSGGIKLGVEGRIRLMHFHHVTMVNRMRGIVEGTWPPTGDPGDETDRA